MKRLRLQASLLMPLCLVLLGGCFDSCLGSSNAGRDEESVMRGGDGAGSGSVSQGAAAPSGDADTGAGSTVVHIAPGEGHVVLLADDGTVWTCGNGGDGQLGFEQLEECFWGVRVDGLPTVTDVAAGTAYSLFLAENGKLWGTGYGFGGQLGPRLDERTYEPIELGIDGLVDIASYTNYALGRRADGSVVAFGVNDAGGLGHGSLDDSATPVETGVVAEAIAAGGSYSLAWKDGRLWSWGMNHYGTLGNPTVPTSPMTGSMKSVAQAYFSLTPVEVSIDRVIAFAAGTDHALAVRDDHTVWGWGRNNNGSLAQARENVIFPTPVPIPGLSDIVAVAAGAEFSMALTSSGEVLTWGPNNSGRLGRTINGRFSAEPTVVAGLPPIEKIFAGWYQAYAIDRTGQGWAWGMNEFGQLAADAEGYVPAPITLGAPD